MSAFRPNAIAESNRQNITAAVASRTTTRTRRRLLLLRSRRSRGVLTVAPMQVAERLGVVATYLRVNTFGKVKPPVLDQGPDDHRAEQQEEQGHGKSEDHVFCLFGNERKNEMERDGRRLVTVRENEKHSLEREDAEDKPQRLEEFGTADFFHTITPFPQARARPFRALQSTRRPTLARHRPTSRAARRRA